MCMCSAPTWVKKGRPTSSSASLAMYLRVHAAAWGAHGGLGDPGLVVPRQGLLRCRAHELLCIPPTSRPPLDSPCVSLLEHNKWC